MSRRALPREYYEEDEDLEIERERDRYPRSRRPERDLDEEVEYRRRRSMPPVEDLERMHIRDRPPRDIVREAYEIPRESGPLVRRSRDERDELSRERELEEPRVRSSRRRGSRSHRPRELVEEEESELIVGERDRRRVRRHRGSHDSERDDVAMRHRGRASEGDLRPRGRILEEEDEVYYRSASRPRRRPSRREVELEEEIGNGRIEDRSRKSHYRREPTYEDELVMSWKDRPSPREQEEEEDIKLRETRRLRKPSQPEPRYVREPPSRDLPGAWPIEEETEEDEVRYRERRRSRPPRHSRHRDSEELEDEILIRRRDHDRHAGRDSMGSDEIVIRRSKEKVLPRERSLSPERIRSPSTVHHRHIDHDFETARPSRAPSPDLTSPRASFDEIDYHQRTRRGPRGRISEEEIVINHRDREESLSPTAGFASNPESQWREQPRRRRGRQPRSLDDRDSISSISGSPPPQPRGLSRGPVINDDIIEEEIKIRRERSERHLREENRKKEEELSIIPSPARDEVVEVSRSLEVVEVAPKAVVQEELEVRGRVEQQVVAERPDERWTEIAKDLVVREAIERLGYEFEETRKFYYIFSFLQPADIDELVELSDAIRHARRRRIKEMQRERQERAPRPKSMVERIPPRPRMSRHIREREWIVEERI
ncbi:Uncharacterized protein PECH_003484 [Penicillium ucsense]|uniref:DUF8035 domain-containing protein n=1 Tax=Penicillium ucsense TaxID=2839758 RepID=A0A8J8WCZ9_9EURO|nr:Uncharacterized protein PECM_005526 [Penicillium ucsense]KAF7737566.1 Uncharacterized protein PECH_003484 [Penicillium ucsense]